MESATPTPFAQARNATSKKLQTSGEQYARSTRIDKLFETVEDKKLLKEDIKDLKGVLWEHDGTVCARWTTLVGAFVSILIIVLVILFIVWKYKKTKQKEIPKASTAHV